MQLTGTRPRVEGEREDEVLEATLALLREVGYDRLTMDGVARRARASKATLYRRWQDKAHLVLDAMVRATDAPSFEDRDTGSLRGDLLATFCGAADRGLTGATDLLGSVVTALASDPEFAELFRQSFIAPKLAVTRAIYARAIDRGEISPDVDVEVIAPALGGILLHRSFVLGLPPDTATVERVLDHVILPAAGIAVGVPPTPSPHRESETT